MNKNLKFVLSLLFLVSCAQPVIYANNTQKDEVKMIPKDGHDCNTASKPSKAPSHYNSPVHVYFESTSSVLEFSTEISGLVTYYIYSLDNTLIQSSNFYSYEESSNIISVDSLPEGEYILVISFSGLEFVGYLSK